MKTLFDKYFYKADDTILIRSSVMQQKTGLALFLAGDRLPPYIYKVQVTNRTWRGYTVVDGDNLKYFVKFKYVITREEVAEPATKK